MKMKMNSSSNSNPVIIDVLQGTRLVAIVLVDGETHIWTATKNRGANYKKWQGTFLRVYHNGLIVRTTIDDAIQDGLEEVVIKWSGS